MFLKNKSEVVTALIEHFTGGKLFHQEKFEEFLKERKYVPNEEMNSLDRNNCRYQLREELWYRGYDLISPMGYKNYLLLCSLPESFVRDKYPVKLGNMGSRQSDLLDQKMKAMRKLVSPERLQEFDKHVTRFTVVVEMLEATVQQLEAEKIGLDIFVFDLITGPDKG